jgi:outer membrane biogenesis lipoprotein LolB
MKHLVTALVAAVLAGCGVETAGTAATAAAIKKQELEQGKKTMEQAQQKIGPAVEQMQQQSAQRGSEGAEK